MECTRCPEGKPRATCKNPRHHCDTCLGIGIVRGHATETALDTFRACPDCQPQPVKLRLVR